MKVPDSDGISETPREHADLLQALQTDVVRLLRRVERLIDDVRDASPETDQAEALRQIDALRSKAQSVELLELRMAVVAPMKAGKSTLINAVIGRDLLPNRAMAMTALPTEIELVDDLDEPVLSLSPAASDVIAQAADETAWGLAQPGPLAEEIRAASPHLEGLLERVRQHGSQAIASEARGVEGVRAALEDLNDLARLGGRVDGVIDVLAALPDVPRVQTPTWHTGDGASDPVAMGRLVLVDTPGPDEASRGLRLAPIVQQELEACAMVLLVLNFTQLSSDAVETIKRLVEPVLRVIGRDQLYVVVNKVDERRHNDMRPDELCRFISQDLDLTEPGQSDHIFETAARRALVARQYQWESFAYDEDPRELTTARDLMWELHTDLWEEELRDASSEKLAESAERVWQKSRVPEFVERAVDVLRVEATPKALDGALHAARGYTRELRDGLQLRRRAFARSEETVTAEVENLESSIRDVDRLRRRARRIDRAAAKLEQSVRGRIEEARREAVRIVDRQVEESFRDKNGGVLADAARKAHTPKPPKDVTREYRSKRAAKKFATALSLLVRDEAELMLAETRSELEKALADHAHKLEDELRDEVAPVVEAAAQRLEDAFEVRPEFPEPVLALELGDIAPVDLQHDVRRVIKGTETTIRQVKRWWTLWGMIPYEERIEQPRTVKEKVFTLSSGEMHRHQLAHLKQHLDELQEQVLAYVRAQFEEAAGEHLDSVYAYLRRYQAHLRDSLADRERSAEEMRERRRALDELEVEAGALDADGRTYARRLAQLASKDAAA